MGRAEKATEVRALTDRLRRARGVVLADFRGLTVAEIGHLRGRLREAGVEFRVVKNRLLRIAARQVGIAGLEPFLEGPTAAAFGYDDPAVPAKIIHDFIRQMRKLEAKGGVMDRQAVTAQQVRALAELPPRPVLLGQVGGGLRAPLAGLVTVLGGPPRALVVVLERIRQQRAAA